MRIAGNLASFGSYRIGLGIGAESVRAVGLLGQRILWALEAQVESGDQLETVVSQLLGSAPRRRFRTPQVFAAVGPAHSQVKQLSGVPPLSDAAMLAEMIRHSAGRFFLRNGVPLASTQVRINENGDIWAGVIDEPIVRAVNSACRSHRLVLRAVTPTVAVLGGTLLDDQIAWLDGDVLAEVSISKTELREVRRLSRVRGAPAIPLRPTAALNTLGAEAARFADAYGAALLGGNSTLAIRERAGSVTANPLGHVRIAIATTALILAITSAFAVPFVASRRDVRHLETRLQELAPSRRAGLSASHALSQVSSAIEEVRVLAEGHPSMTLFLRDLTRALPQQSAITAIRTDSAGATIVALTPRASDLLRRLEQTPGLVAPQIIGPVTREPGVTEEVERVTIRLSFGKRTNSTNSGNEQ